MSERSETFRHGLAAGGLAMTAGTGLLVLAFGVPTGLEALTTIGALSAVGCALLLAGVRDWIGVGGVGLAWNRLAAVAIGLIAVYLGAGAAVTLAGGVSSLYDLSVLLMFAVAPYFGWLALECWVGGRHTDRELFAAD